MPIREPSGVEETANEGALRPRLFRSEAEMAIRGAMEAWSRSRWPDRRIVHELVVGRGNARADMAAIGDESYAAIEIKGPYDDSARTIHQAGTFRLCCPELWLVVSKEHVEDAELVRYLIPTVGIALAQGMQERQYGLAKPVKIDVLHEAAPFPPHGGMLLSVLWVEELRRQAHAHRCADPKTHRRLVEELDAKLTPDEKLKAVCAELRRREFAFRSDSPQWRADPPKE